MNYVIGIAENGERLRFERWVFERWTSGNLGDAFLIGFLRRCVRFKLLYCTKEV